MGLTDSDPQVLPREGITDEELEAFDRVARERLGATIVDGSAFAKWFHEEGNLADLIDEALRVRPTHQRQQKAVPPLCGGSANCRALRGGRFSAAGLFSRFSLGSS